MVFAKTTNDPVTSILSRYGKVKGKISLCIVASSISSFSAVYHFNEFWFCDFPLAQAQKWIIIIGKSGLRSLEIIMWKIIKTKVTAPPAVAAAAKTAVVYRLFMDLVLKEMCINYKWFLSFVIWLELEQTNERECKRQKNQIYFATGSSSPSLSS